MNPLPRILQAIVPSELPLQAKILKYTSLIIIFASLAGIFVNASLGFPIELNIVIAGFTAYVIYLFKTMPTDGYYDRTSFIIIALSLATLAFNWFPNGGMYSSSPYMFLLLVGFAGVTMQGTYLWSGITLCVLTFCSLIYFETHYPTWVAPIDPQSLQVKLDIIFAVILLSYLMAWFISTIIQLNKKRYEQLIEASEAKTLFLSQLSHELLTPLNSVIGFSNLLKKQELSAAQRQFVESINNNGNHLFALVNQILDLSALETGKIELTYQRVDLSQLLADLHEAMAANAEAKDLAFDLIGTEEKDHLLLHSDPNRLRQILMSLLSNAIKFTDTGHVLCRVEETPENIVIDIEDTGTGIPVDQQVNVFEPLFRLPEHMQKEGKGIGLSITQALCDHMGYTLQLLTSSVQGSTFRVIIPQDARYQPDAAETLPAVEVSTTDAVEK